MTLDEILHELQRLRPEEADQHPLATSVEIALDNGSVSVFRARGRLTGRPSWVGSEKPSLMDAAETVLNALLQAREREKR